MALTPFEKYKQILIRESDQNIDHERKQEFGKWLAHLWDYLSDQEQAIILNASWDRSAIVADMASNFCRSCFGGIPKYSRYYTWCSPCMTKHYDALVAFNAEFANLTQAGMAFEPSIAAILQAYLFKNFNVERVALKVETTYTTPVAAVPTKHEKVPCKKAYYGIDCNCGACPKKTFQFAIR